MSASHRGGNTRAASQGNGKGCSSLHSQEDSCTLRHRSVALTRHVHKYSQCSAALPHSRQSHSTHQHTAAAIHHQQHNLQLRASRSTTLVATSVGHKGATLCGCCLLPLPLTLHPCRSHQLRRLAWQQALKADHVLRNTKQVLPHEPCTLRTLANVQKEHTTVDLSPTGCPNPEPLTPCTPTHSCAAVSPGGVCTATQPSKRLQAARLRRSECIRTRLLPHATHPQTQQHMHAAGQLGCAHAGLQHSTPTHTR